MCVSSLKKVKVCAKKIKDISMIQKELKLRIADIVISVISEDKKQKFGVDGPYKYFVTDGKPDISFYTHYGYIPKSKLGKKIFDTGTTWSLYQNNGRHILKTYSKVIILESDFKSGDIYIRTQGAKRKVGYPLNYPLDEVLMINLLAQERGVMIHSCGVSSKGEGLLFAGTSQMGKSTMANLWKKSKVQVAETRSQGQKITIFSDDRVIIQKMYRRFWIYGTPWHGDAKVCSPERAPLKKIFFLKHAKKNSVKKIEPLDAASRLIVCSFPTFWDKKGMEFTLKFCSELAQKIPCYELGFFPNNSVLDFIKNHR